MTAGRNHKRAVCGALLALLLGTGCVASRGAMKTEVLSLGSRVGTFRLEYPPTKEEDAAMLRKALEWGAPRLARWGELRERVTVRLHADHRGLGEAARHSEFVWLRAWARYETVDVQAPSTWAPIPGTQRALDELVLHELTHTLMYQASSDQGGWRQKKIPAWFREGMASYTAEQGYRWPTLEQLARLLEEHPEWEPLLRPEPLYREQMAVAYGAAHHAFTFLVHRYGEETVRTLLREMSRGLDFPVAFTASVGLPPETFLRDFSRYLRLRGFQGGRILRPPPSP